MTSLRRAERVTLLMFSGVVLLTLTLAFVALLAYQQYQDRACFRDAIVARIQISDDEFRLAALNQEALDREAAAHDAALKQPTTAARIAGIEAALNQYARARAVIDAERAQDEKLRAAHPIAVACHIIKGTG